MEEEIRLLLDLPAEDSANYIDGVHFNDLVTFLGSKMGKVYIDLHEKHLADESRIADIEAFKTSFMTDYTAFQAEYALYKTNVQLQIDTFQTDLGTLAEYQASIQDTVA